MDRRRDKQDSVYADGRDRRPASLENYDIAVLRTRDNRTFLHVRIKGFTRHPAAAAAAAPTDTTFAIMASSKSWLGRRGTPASSCVSGTGPLSVPGCRGAPARPALPFPWSTRRDACLPQTGTSPGILTPRSFRPFCQSPRRRSRALRR